MEERVNKEGTLEPVRQISDDEIDLVQLVLILLKRKWMIVAVTVLLTVSAAGITMLLPKIYAVSTILEPARDAKGKQVESPQTIRENIISGTYNRPIIEKLNLKIEDFPKFKVTVPKSTTLVKVVVESSEPDRAVSILDALLQNIKNGLDDKLEIKKKFLQNKLRSKEIIKELLQKQIAQLEKLVVVTEQKIFDTENIRKKSMAGDTSNSMMILLSLNELQNKQVFLNGLYREIAELRQRDDRAAVAISDKQLELIKLKGLSVLKSPEISNKPVKPKKKLIVALALVLGLMAGVMLAFWAEFMVMVKSRLATDKI